MTKLILTNENYIKLMKADPPKKSTPKSHRFVYKVFHQKYNVNL